MGRRSVDASSLADVLGCVRRESIESALWPVDQLPVAPRPMHQEEKQGWSSPRQKEAKWGGGGWRKQWHGGVAEAVTRGGDGRWWWWERGQDQRVIRWRMVRGRRWWGQRSKEVASGGNDGHDGETGVRESYEASVFERLPSNCSASLQAGKWGDCEEDRPAGGRTRTQNRVREGKLSTRK
ncbi:hypothetical protein AMTRI_Chr01g136330 [Amborella trichopoda]